MKKAVVINLQFEGIHHWPEAREILPQVGYLSDPHRHIFHIEMMKEVGGSNREIEFIDWKHQVEEYLFSKYPNKQLGAKSCEMLAEELLEKFDCLWVKIMEDGENGALLIKE